MRIDEIRPYERNARHNERAIPKVAESIKAFGLRGTICLESRDNPVIVFGHTRVTVWSPKSVIKTREEARAATVREMARQFVNDDYYAYLRATAKAGGVKLGSVKKWSKIKQKMDLAGVKYLDKSEYINTRE